MEGFKKNVVYVHMIKFIYSEKATKFCEISTVDLTGTKAELPKVGIFFRTQFPSLGIFINKKVDLSFFDFQLFY